jgi:hypothetical protein
MNPWCSKCWKEVQEAVMVEKRMLCSFHALERLSELAAPVLLGSGGAGIAKRLDSNMVAFRTVLRHLENAIREAA